MLNVLHNLEMVYMGMLDEWAGRAEEGTMGRALDTGRPGHRHQTRKITLSLAAKYCACANQTTHETFKLKLRLLK